MDTPQEMPQVETAKKTPKEMPQVEKKYISSNILTNCLLENLVLGILSNEQYNIAAQEINMIRRYREMGLDIPEIDDELNEMEKRIIHLLKSLPESEEAIENFKEICKQN